MQSSTLEFTFYHTISRWQKPLKAASTAREAFGATIDLGGMTRVIEHCSRLAETNGEYAVTLAYEPEAWLKRVTWKNVEVLP